MPTMRPCARTIGASERSRRASTGRSTRHSKRWTTWTSIRAPSAGSAIARGFAAHSVSKPHNSPHVHAVRRARLPHPARAERGGPGLIPRSVCSHAPPVAQDLSRGELHVRPHSSRSIHRWSRSRRPARPRHFNLAGIGGGSPSARADAGLTVAAVVTPIQGRSELGLQSAYVSRSSPPEDPFSSRSRGGARAVQARALSSVSRAGQRSWERRSRAVVVDAAVPSA